MLYFLLGLAPEGLEELCVRPCSEFLAEACGGQVLGGAEKPMRPQDPMAATSSRLEAAPEKDGAGQVFLEPHLPLQGTFLTAPSAACPSRELETSQPKLPIT